MPNAVHTVAAAATGGIISTQKASPKHKNNPRENYTADIQPLKSNRTKKFAEKFAEAIAVPKNHYTFAGTNNTNV